MKKSFAIVAVLALVVFVGTACSKGGGQKLTKEEVAKSLPAAMCAKMEKCIPAGGPTKDECIQAMSKQIIDGKGGVQFPTITSTQLQACIAGFAEVTCDKMMTSSEPPKGCEFLPKKGG